MLVIFHNTQIQVEQVFYFIMKITAICFTLSHVLMCWK